MGDSFTVIRYFKSAAAVYEQVRFSLDASWGHPNAEAQTCFLPAAEAPKAADGRVMLAVASAFCELDAVQASLPSLLDSGVVVEISGFEFQQAIASL